jgi:hypothetical protein
MITLAIKLKNGEWITLESEVDINNKFLISSEVVSELLHRGINTGEVEEIIAN